MPISVHAVADVQDTAWRFASSSSTAAGRAESDQAVPFHVATSGSSSGPVPCVSGLSEPTATQALAETHATALSDAVIGSGPATSPVPGKLDGLGTVCGDQLEPFHSSATAPGPGPAPTASQSDADTHETADSGAAPVGSAVQLEPFQTAESPFSPALPTATQALAAVQEMPVSVVPEAPPAAGNGTVSAVHVVPFHCSATGAFEPPAPVSPTAMQAVAVAQETL